MILYKRPRLPFLLRRDCALIRIRNTLNLQSMLGSLVGRPAVGVGPDWPNFGNGKAVGLKLTCWARKNHRKYLTAGWYHKEAMGIETFKMPVRRIGASQRAQVTYVAHDCRGFTGSSLKRHRPQSPENGGLSLERLGKLKMGSLLWLASGFV